MLEEIVRLPDEDYSDYFRRVLEKVAKEQKVYVILIGFQYVDVTPETTYDYLRGFFEAILGPLN